MKRHGTKEGGWWRSGVARRAVTLGGVLLLGAATAASASAQTIFAEDWEGGWGNWIADNGVWQIGAPAPGTVVPIQGTRLAATDLSGTHPGNTSSTLISPTITLPSVFGDEEIHLRFWQWFSYSSCDYGQVQVKYFDPGSGIWTNFSSIGVSVADTSDWSIKDVDLTGFAGLAVKIGFYHHANSTSYGCSGTGWGWYIDDISITCSVPVFTGSFENGWGDWGADRGVWQVGSPTAGPAMASGGLGCAGTELDSTHDPNTDSRLVSPSVTLPGVVGDEEVHLRFMSWFSSSSFDYAQVQVSSLDPATGTWSGWVDVGQSIADTSSWSLKDVDLTSYAGQKVRLAFYHSANYSSYGCSGTSTGWYIDDVEISRASPTFTGDFEAGWYGWSAERGVWQVGPPTFGPSAAHEGACCAGTELDAVHDANTDSRPVSPTITLPGVGGDEEVHLRFMSWFSYSSCDYAYVQVSSFDPATGTWSGWTNLGPSIADTSDWSLVDEDLTGYAGQKVRLAFYHTADYSSYGCSGTSSGWYIDQVEVVRAAPLLDGEFEYGWRQWGTDRGVWEVGTPTAGPPAAGSGNGVAGTNLDGDYGGNTDSRLISPAIHLPAITGPQQILLQFKEWFSYSSCDYGQVQSSTYDPSTGLWSAWTNEGPQKTGASGGWSQGGLDLTHLAGQTIRIAFYHTANYSSYGCSGTGTGWYIDRVEFIFPVFSTYCTAAPNSVTERGALIEASGSSSLAANDLQLAVDGLPDDEFGMFFYGPMQSFAPFGDGRLCVGSQIRILPPVKSSSTGTVSHWLDYDSPPANSGIGQILPGSTWYFQYWYRDPANGGTGFNTTNGLRSIFYP